MGCASSNQKEPEQSKNVVVVDADVGDISLTLIPEANVSEGSMSKSNITLAKLSDINRPTTAAASAAKPEKKSWNGKQIPSKPTTVAATADDIQSKQISIDSTEDILGSGTGATEGPPTLAGQGKYKHADGSEYEGSWKDGMRHGYGIYRLHGDVYEGHWENDSPHGKGKYSFSNGEIYEGDYYKGKRSGKGKYRYADGTAYEGEYVDGRQQGIGAMKYVSGHLYEGEFVDSKMNGKGTMRYADGRVYSGELLDGKMHGQGVMKDANGEVIFEGQWDNGASKTASGAGNSSTPRNEEKTELCGPASRYYCG